MIVPNYDNDDDNDDNTDDPAEGCENAMIHAIAKENNTNFSIIDALMLFNRVTNDDDCTLPPVDVSIINLLSYQSFIHSINITSIFYQFQS